MSAQIPLNELDAAIKAMTKSHAAFPDFCRAVCEGQLWVLLPYQAEMVGEQIEIANGRPFPFALVQEQKGDAVPVYSSEARVNEGLRTAPANTFSVCAMQAMQVLEILGTTKFGMVINKGCATGALTIWPDLMRDLVSGKALKATEMGKVEREHSTINILNPADYPTEVVQRAFECLRRHKEFRAAWIFRKGLTGPTHYQLLVLMDPRDDTLFHDLNLTVHSNHSHAYETHMGLIDEKNPPYVASLFAQAVAFYVAADYQLPPGAKV